MKSATTKVPNGHGTLYKEVRFSPTATPIRRAQSVSGSTPASKVEYGRVLGMVNRDRSSYLAMSADYLDQARSLLDRQRVSFENERALFGMERQLWEKERALLKQRILELEALLKSKNTNPGSPTSSTTTVKFSLNPFGGPTSSNSTDERHQSHHPYSAQIWEGSSPMSRPTRVFPDIDLVDGQNHPASIAEQGAHLSLTAPSLDAALSPPTRATDLSAGASISVPIEKLDSKLDGITLKSSALPPEVVARVMTPPSPSPEGSSTASSDQPRTPSERKNSLKLKLSELGPPDMNLVRDAGHTPMAIIDIDADTEHTSVNGDFVTQTKEEELLAPRATTAGQPAENCDSYFPDVPEDPALKGPLSLLNEEEHDNEFLQELDQKLLDQAMRAIGRRPSEPDDQDEKDADPAGQDESVPELKFKNTTNFGTAFGRSDFGKV
ncbi:uncharacterized protein ACLA_012320 [Aspergillus clavatus NRRL 1]|uniref:Uncharacterized protein n=1 Tax=Aspergillus clavatus (strain ATCC 1007 / CBS 513.65 / DSM 816 / NCTC 3887 / NRRL 1 / QM 1276 / 107) TaxID=344612 RepID=A1CAN6_ASPCL|nr:uncharacterized protein ACLA_012320 [Aspergillus clavatus NRRL 1]EAW12804.1 conserved hypothetical protein [Aspergillus clavatus NRRL 1]